jgi:hypothetical protein
MCIRVYCSSTSLGWLGRCDENTKSKLEVFQTDILRQVTEGS